MFEFQNLSFTQALDFYILKGYCVQNIEPASVKSYYNTPDIVLWYFGAGVFFREYLTIIHVSVGE